MQDENIARNQLIQIVNAFRQDRARQEWDNTEILDWDKTTLWETDWERWNEPKQVLACHILSWYINQVVTHYIRLQLKDRTEVFCTRTAGAYGSLVLDPAEGLGALRGPLPSVGYFFKPFFLLLFLTFFYFFDLFDFFFFYFFFTFFLLFWLVWLFLLFCLLLFLNFF